MNELSDGFETTTGDSGDIVIDCGKGAIWTTNSSVCGAEALEGLWGCDFVNKVGIDKDQTSAIVLLVDEVGIPDLVVDSLRR
jgi:hypothetical protein